MRCQAAVGLCSILIAALGVPKKTLGSFVDLGEKDFPGLSQITLDGLTFQGLHDQLPLGASRDTWETVFTSKDSSTVVAFYALTETQSEGMPDSPPDPSSAITDVWITEVWSHGHTSASVTRAALQTARSSGQVCTTLEDDTARISDSNAIAVRCSGRGSVIVDYQVFPSCESGQRGPACLLGRTSIYLQCHVFPCKTDQTTAPDSASPHHSSATSRPSGSPPPRDQSN
jgi:hypothetical protein